MTVFIQSGLFVIGFAMLVKGADWFVDGASGIAFRFGIPQLVIGLTIVAMGTSAPEAAVSITAAMRGNADITIGNIVGSNILNILIILGISSVITTIAVAKSTIKYEIPIMIGITFLLLFVGMDESVTFAEGLIFLAIFVAYLAYVFCMAKKNKEEAEGTKELTILKAVVLTGIGLALVVWGSDITVEAAGKLARIFGLSERFIGLTIVAFGTSLPELFTSVLAARKGNADIAIGNIVGSNIFNILFVVGLSALITPIPFTAAFRIDTLAAAVAAFILLFCCLKDKSLKRWHGVIMLGSYTIYFIYLCI